MTDTHWPDYYAVTRDRPAWHTVTEAIASFEAEPVAPGSPPRLAVDLGCGAGRDARALLAAGWWVLAVDAEETAIDALVGATPEAERGRLETAVADIATVAIPPCDLVNASVSLQFLDPAAFDAVIGRVAAALRPGGRFTALVYGDRDQAAGDPELTCVSEARLRELLADFEMESWTEREEDGQMALGDPHHIHLFELVARRR